MVDATRALLDELMGRDRDKAPAARNNKAAHFTDPDICKFYICGFCPHDLFINTKSDLGACPKTHDDSCKEEYQKSTSKSKYPFERDWIRFMERMTDDLDRRIRKGHERLDVVSKDETPESQLSATAAAKVEEISKKIQGILTQVEVLAESGRIDESQQLMKLVDNLKAEKEALIDADARAIAQNEKKMKVCDICGAFLVVGDTDKRTASHLDGKQHQGFDLLRKTISEYKKRERDDYSLRRDDGYRGSRGRDDRRGHNDGYKRERERDRRYDEPSDRDKKRYR